MRESDRLCIQKSAETAAQIGKNDIQATAKAHFCISEFLRVLHLFHAAEYPALRRLYRGKHTFASADYCAYTRKHIFGQGTL